MYVQYNTIHVLVCTHGESRKRGFWYLFDCGPSPSPSTPLVTQHPEEGPEEENVLQNMECCTRQYILYLHKSTHRPNSWKYLQIHLDTDTDTDESQRSDLLFFFVFFFFFVYLYYCIVHTDNLSLKKFL